MRNRHLFSFCLGCVAIVAVNGCAATIKRPQAPVAKTQLEVLFEQNFAGFQPPSPQRADEGGVSHEFVHTTFAEVWDGALVLLMQRGIIVHASKATGVIVAVNTNQTTTREEGAFVLPSWQDTTLPLVLHIQEKEPTEVRVSINWLEELGRTSDAPPRHVVRITQGSKQLQAKSFFDLLATQIFARHKASYLFG
ncbi:MAG: hypothetical protein AB7G75_11035 [Candidatus Binatia bacterium]